jgi:hypothetical protein
VTISAQVNVPLIFLRAFGNSATVVAAFGQAARRDVQEMVVLDRSGSMLNDIGMMKSAAVSFVNKFAEGRDKLGLVVFGGSAIVAYPLSATFKSAISGIPHYLNEIAAGSDTGMAEALWIAYQQLRNNPLPGALNVIVLFTDGLPNGLTADFNQSSSTYINPASGCVYKNGPGADPTTHMLGWIGADGAFNLANNNAGAGIYTQMVVGASHTVDNWMTHPNDDMTVIGPQPTPPPTPSVYTASTGCYYGYYNGGNPPSTPSNSNTSHPRSMYRDLLKIPTWDLYGNGTNTGQYNWAHPVDAAHPVYDPTKTNNSYHLGVAFWNAVDDAANRIRYDDYLTPVIYCIGLSRTGTTGQPDVMLMKRLANDATANNYNPAKRTGKYYEVNDPTAIDSAFTAVASEILRISQ